MIPVSTAFADDPCSRRESYIAAAQDMFFSHGYAGTTMSAVAAAVGGSKTTLWSCFAGKDELFAAVVDDIVERFGTALSIELADDLPVEQGLRLFGTAMLSTVLSQPIVALHRLVTGEAGRFPELGALFYERGARRGKAKLAAYFATAMAAGRLRPGDPMTAARQFSAMCQAGCFNMTLYAIGQPGRDEIMADVEAAIDSFMRAWAVKSRHGHATDGRDRALVEHAPDSRI